MIELLHHFTHWKDKLNILYLIGIFHALAFSFISISFPLYVIEVGGTALIVGIAAAIFGIMKLLSSFIGGYFSDFSGRKKTLQLSLILFIISGFLYYFSSHYYSLLIGKLFQGIAGGLFWMSITSLIEENANKKKATSIGLLQSARSIITLLTVLLSGFIITYFSIRLTLLLFSLIFIFNYTFTLFNFKNEEKIKLNKPCFKFKEFTNIVKNFLFEKRMASLVPILFAIGVFGGFEAFLPLYGLKLGMNYIELGILKIMTLAGFVFIPFLSGKYSDNISRKTPIILGNLLAIIFIICLFFVTNKYMAMILFLFLTLSIIIPYPSIVAMINERLDKKETGRFNGLLITFKMLGLVISSLLSGYIFNSSNYLYVFLLLGGVFFIAFLSSFKLHTANFIKRRT